MCPIVFLAMMYLAGACNYQCQYCSSTSHRFSLTTHMTRFLQGELWRQSNVWECFTMDCSLYCSKYYN